MTSGLKALHVRALGLADDYVARVRSNDLDRPTPCTGWSLADLLAHMVGQHLGFAQAARDGSAPTTAYRAVAFTPSAWRESVTELTSAFAAADLDGEAVLIELSPRPILLQRALAAQLLDTVIHTWDIAQTLGAEFVPPDDLLTATYAVAVGIPEQAYGPGAAFAQPLEPTGSAWADTLAIVGRRVGAPPTKE